MCVCVCVCVCVCMYVCMYKVCVKVNSGNESDNMKKIEKIRNPNEMNLLLWKVNVKTYRF